MTWEEWVNSSYNTDGYYINVVTKEIYSPSGGSRVALSKNGTDFVFGTDAIINGSTYFTSTSGGSGN